MNDMLRGIGAEYSDEVTKSNKKEDMMLERKLRFLERQERISQNFIRKNRRDIEKLQQSIQDMDKRAISLKHYDWRLMNEKANRYCLSKPNDTRYNYQGVMGKRLNTKLPPINKPVAPGHREYLTKPYQARKQNSITYERIPKGCKIVRQLQL